jgi:uncharacterized membrane protein YhaH (DUF805 family)
MDIQYVLLSPNGRIGPRDFGRGLILLTAAMMIVQIAVALVSPAFGVLQYPLVFSYVCVFGKRLHDGGHSAWFYLLFLAGYFVLSTTATAILMPFLSPDALAMQVDFQKLAMEGQFNAAVEEAAKIAPELARQTVLTTIAAFLLTSGALGLIGARLRSDPSTNRFGPPSNGSGEPDTFS